MREERPIIALDFPAFEDVKHFLEHFPEDEKNRLNPNVLWLFLDFSFISYYNVEKPLKWSREAPKV